MLDQLLGIILLGLGLRSPLDSQNVLGTQSNKQLAIIAQNEGDDDAESDPTETPSMIDGIPSNIPAERREKYKKEMERRKAELETKRKTAEALYKEKREALKTQFLENKDVYRTQKRNHEEFKANVTAEKEAFIESIKAKIEQSKAQRETRLANFKEKMHAFKDSARKTKVENIQARITALVTKRIETFTAHITKMTDLVNLNKVQVTERATGKDTTAFDSAASSALTAINNAKDKVAELSAKQYVISITSESTAKSDVKKVHDAVAGDIKSVMEHMKNARIAISTMITERAKLLGEPVPEAVIK